MAQSKSPLGRIDAKTLWHPFTQMQEWEKADPIIIESGNGDILRDTNGNEYIDGISSLWVTVHGHRKKEIDEAIKGQLGKIAHSTLLGLSNVPAIQLAERLVSAAPKGLARVFYSDNGSTAVEVALKMAFQYWQLKGKKKKTKFVAFQEGYHGDTIGSVSVGGISLFHEIFKPLLFQTLFAPTPYLGISNYAGESVSPKSATTYRYLNYPFAPPDSRSDQALAALEKILKKSGHQIAALIVEPLVQGAGGMLMAPGGVLKKIRELCSKYDVLMIADEVAVGFGRTGKLFACEHEDVSPDLMCLSKGLTGGYMPLAATLTTENIYKAFLGSYGDQKTFFHGHTYTGNPLACAAAVASFDLFKKDNLLAKAVATSQLMTRELKKELDLVSIGQIRQCGMIVGIELVKDRKKMTPHPWQSRIGYKVCDEARKRGALLRPLGNTIVLMPPLSISDTNLRKLVKILRESIQGVS